MTIGLRKFIVVSCSSGIVSREILLQRKFPISYVRKHETCLTTARKTERLNVLQNVEYTGNILKIAAV